MIDLTQFKETDEKKSINQISNYLESLGMNTNIKWLADDLHSAKSGFMVWGKPFTYQKNWTKVWFFKDTLKIFAFENSTGKHFTQDFISFMESVQSLTPGDTPVFFKSDPYIPYDDERDPVISECKTIDDVLDKINNYGIDSLSDYELKILQRNS
jgi:hypothetical protein